MMTELFKNIYFSFLDITIILDIFVTKVMEEPPFQLIVL